jgi:hypothetical protein
VLIVSLFRLNDSTTYHGALNVVAPISCSQSVDSSIASFNMGALVSLPLTTALAIPLFSSYTTSFNLLFFAVNWYILLLTHTPIVVELYGLTFIRLFFFLLPALTFFAFDFGLPSVSENIKAHGKYALPNRLGQNKAWNVAGVAVGNTLLGIGLTLGLESLFKNVFMVKSLLHVGKRLPFPWKAVQSVIFGMITRGVSLFLSLRRLLTISVSTVLDSSICVAQPKL